MTLDEILESFDKDLVRSMTLKEILKHNKINKPWLAERLGLSRPTLDKYLNKPDEFKIKHLRRMAKYLNITEREVLVKCFINSKL
jgi:transcriptional regulator with XRE-family HTH domain|tara:strand:+ start:2266 stop:2520 length:255 start_codon:yes stop_codon:yes gene_type:complete